MARSPHDIAWDEVRKELYGTVCEVARRVPWGFKNDMSSIYNATVDEFLSSERTYGTIMLHILSGEGEPLDRVLKTIESAYKRCVKLVVLEHNPNSTDWSTDSNVTNDKLDAIKDYILKLEPNAVTNNFGRNMTISTTTLAPLWLPLNNSYFSQEINKHYVTSIDKGCDTTSFLYTLTSEAPIDDSEFVKIPTDRDFYWVIGGGWCFEAIPRLAGCSHTLIDVVLRQVIYCRWLLEENKDDAFNKKINQLFSVESFKETLQRAPEFQEQNGNPEHWRNVVNAVDLSEIAKNVKEIRHMSLSEMKNKGDTIYVSTVDKSLWSHLGDDNVIISSYEPPRDVPKVFV